MTYRNKDGTVGTTSQEQNRISNLHKYFSYSYTGIVTVTPEFALILAGSKDAQTTSFGNARKPDYPRHPFTRVLILSSVTQITFETGAEPLKDLENRIFVGSARFVVIESGYFIETKISQVVG